MPRPVAKATLTHATHRRRLTPGRHPPFHYPYPHPNRTHLGYQRDEDTLTGRWLLRRYNPKLPAATPLHHYPARPGRRRRPRGRPSHPELRAGPRRGRRAHPPTTPTRPGHLTVGQAIAHYFESTSRTRPAHRDLKGRAKPTSSQPWAIPGSPNSPRLSSASGTPPLASTPKPVRTAATETNSTRRAPTPPTIFAAAAHRPTGF